MAFTIALGQWLDHMSTFKQILMRDWNEKLFSCNFHLWWWCEHPFMHILLVYVYETGKMYEEIKKMPIPGCFPRLLDEISCLLMCNHETKCTHNSQMAGDKMRYWILHSLQSFILSYVMVSVPSCLNRNYWYSARDLIGSTFGSNVSLHNETIK